MTDARRVDRRYRLLAGCECHAPAMGHDFGYEGQCGRESAKETVVDCDSCGKTWEEHQLAPVLCPALVARLRAVMDAEAMIEAGVAAERKAIAARAAEQVAAACAAAEARVEEAEKRVAELAVRVSAFLSLPTP